MKIVIAPAAFKGQPGPMALEEALGEAYGLLDNPHDWPDAQWGPQKVARLSGDRLAEATERAIRLVALGGRQG